MEITPDYLKEFRELVGEDVAVPVCCMKALLSVIKSSESVTWMQLERELREAIHILKNCDSADLKGRTKISLGSGCDLFMKYVTRAFLEYSVSDISSSFVSCLFCQLSRNLCAKDQLLILLCAYQSV